MKIRKRLAKLVRDLRELDAIRPTDKITYSNLDCYQITIIAPAGDCYSTTPLRYLTIYNTFKEEFSQKEIILDNSDNSKCKIDFCFPKTEQTTKESSKKTFFSRFTKY